MELEPREACWGVAGKLHLTRLSPVKGRLRGIPGPSTARAKGWKGDGGEMEKRRKTDRGKLKGRWKGRRKGGGGASWMVFGKPNSQ